MYKLFLMNFSAKIRFSRFSKFYRKLLLKYIDLHCRINVREELLVIFFLNLELIYCTNTMKNGYSY